MNDETYTPCTKCGRPLSYCKGQCCGKTKGCQCREYGPKVCGAIRPGEPKCPYQAVIPSLTVESVSNLKDLADCFVHVSDINTTFYIDDKHRIMTTWAGLVSVEDYDFEANPLNLRGQIAYDSKNNVAAIYDKQGANYIFQISDIDNDYMLLENKPQINGVTLLGNKSGSELGLQDKLVAGDNIQIAADGKTISATDTTYGPATDDDIGMVKPGDGLEVESDGTLNAPYKERMDENYRVSKVNGAKANSLFPDVTKFGGKYYMVFRTGTLHASFDGEIALCESEDGINWSAPISILATAGVDYRDPFLSVLDNELYLSCFTRVDNGDDTVTLTGYIYTLAPDTGTTTVARTIANEAIFGKIINANGSILFGSYNSSGCYIYRGTNITDATVAKTFLSGYELTLRYFNNKYYLLTRDSSGISLSESTDLSTWTAISIPQMTAADSFTKIGDKYLIGYRDSIINKHEYGNFAIAVFDDAFNVVDIYKVFPSQTQDCGYSAIYYDEEETQIVVATYLQDGASVSSVYTVLIKGADVTPLAILRNRFDLDNCLKPATLSNERDYASAIELINKETHGKFINMLDGNGDIKGQIYKDPNSALLYLENPTGGVFIKGSSNTSFGVGTYNNIELQGTGNVLMRQSLEVRGTINTQNLKVRALNNASSPYADVVKMSSGTYANIPAVSAVPTGYMYWDTTNARLLVNAGGAWKVITLTNP